MVDTKTSGDSVRLEVANFGPIVKGTVDLRPFTLFVGPSNTGKSYVAMLVYALHLLFGLQRRVPVRYRRDIALSPKGTRRATGWVERVVSEPGTMAEALRGALPQELHDSVYPLLKRFGESGSTLKTEIARCFGVSAAERLIRAGANEANVVLQRFVGNGADRELPFMYALRVGGKQPGFVASIPKNKPLRMDERQAYFVDRWVRFAAAREIQKMDSDERDRIATGIVQDIAESVFPYVTGPLSCPAYYLPADRAGVMHAHRVVVASVVERASSSGILPAPQVPLLSGVLGDFLQQLITFEENRLNHNEVMERLTERLEHDVLGGAVRVKRRRALGALYPMFSYRPVGWKGDLPLMNASSMVSELAPVVLYLRHLVRPGDVLIIEEPESHLHPAMQVALVRRLAEAVRAGVRVILTTHSEWVLEELANLVRLSHVAESRRVEIDEFEFALPSQDVGAWLFVPKRRPRGSTIKEIRLDVESGAFPVGFSEVAAALHNKWAEISSLIEEDERQ